LHAHQPAHFFDSALRAAGVSLVIVTGGRSDFFGLADTGEGL
jgi:hypothetical protein